MKSTSFPSPTNLVAEKQIERVKDDLGNFESPLTIAAIFDGATAHRILKNPGRFCPGSFRPGSFRRIFWGWGVSVLDGESFRPICWVS